MLLKGHRSQDQNSSISKNSLKFNFMFFIGTTSLKNDFTDEVFKNIN